VAPAQRPEELPRRLALVQLDQPVTGVAPVALGGTPPDEARILGQGRPVAPGSHASLEVLFDSTLRQAVLRPMTDAACARAFRHVRGNEGERYDAARMVCAVDVDGCPPLSSGCNGDSGGPLYAGTAAAPILLGVVSWGGLDCGARHVPSVFAEVGRYRTFITDPTPTWKPIPTGPATMRGKHRSGARLTCSAPRFTNVPTKVATSWLRLGPRRPNPIAYGKAYTVRKLDRGHQLTCRVHASNDGGPSDALSLPIAIPRR
jgi:hypothetical protein